MLRIPLVRALSVCRLVIVMGCGFSAMTAAAEGEHSAGATSGGRRYAPRVIARLSDADIARINQRIVVPPQAREQVRVAAYMGSGAEGVGAVSRAWVRSFLQAWQSADPRVVFSELDAAAIRGGALRDLPNLSLYIQPGGLADRQQAALGAQGRAEIRHAMYRPDGPVAYLGICAGAWFAARSYQWYGLQFQHPHVLAEYPGQLVGPLIQLADFNRHQYALTGVGGHAPTAPRLDMIYFGGPTVAGPLAHGFEPLLHFDNVPGAPPAAWRRPGMLLCSTHPEAAPGLGIEGLSVEDRDANYAWLAAALNEAAGTDFALP